MEHMLLFVSFYVVAFLAIIGWSVVWKGLALWHSARRKEKGWFVVLLIVNTLGILEIVYLVFVAKVFDKKQ